MPATEPRPRLLVEAGWGLGDLIEAAPACHALWLLGFDVDFLVNRPDAARIAPLFAGNDVYGRVITSPAEVDADRYDVGVACYGPAQAVRKFPPGFWFSTSIRDVVRDGLPVANIEAARRLGHEGPPPPHPLHLEEVEAPEGCVVVHAGSDPRAKYKRWPHWDAICARLEKRGVPVVVVGTKEDRSDSGWEARHDVREGQPLPVLAGLLRKARAYLGADSGVSHLAGAVGTPGLLLFGPSDPRLYAPPSEALRILDTPPRPGEWRHPGTPGFPTMDRHDVGSVWREVERLLESPPRRSAWVAPPRREAPRGDADARLPSPREIEEAPATREGMDELLRRTSAAAILGWLARRGDPAESKRWTRAAARAAGLAHLRAADVRRAERTPLAHRRTRLHLRQAFRAGFVVRAGLRRLIHHLTPRPRHDPAGDFAD